MNKGLPLVVLLAACAHVGRPAGGQTAMVRGWAALLDGKSTLAAIQLDRALAADPKNLDALYGRALVAEESGDLARAFGLWVKLLEGGSQNAASARALDLALAAARRLDSLVGEVAGTDAIWVALDVERMPAAARRWLLAARAQLKRRSGDEEGARRLDRARGCPDQWWADGPVGTLPRLDLESASPPVSAEARAAWRPVKTRACAVGIDVPVGRPGVVWLIGFVHAPRQTAAEVGIENDGPWRLFVDGAPLFSSRNQERYPPRERHLDLELGPGWHQVAVAFAGTGGRAEAAVSVRGRSVEFFSGEAAHAPNTFGHARLLGPQPETSRIQGGKAAVGRETGRGEARRALLDEGGLPPLIAELLAVERALAYGDADEGEEQVLRLLERAPRFAIARLLAARLASLDPSRPLRFAQERARRQFERALSIDPALVDARVRLAMMAVEAERPRDALARLADAPPSSPPSWRLQLVRHLALRAREWLPEAEAALDEARRIDPHACPPIEAAYSLARERHDVPRRRELARLAARCAGGSDELAETLRDTGDEAGAVLEYQRLLALDPSHAAWRAGLAQTLMQVGRAAEASRIYEELAARFPRAAHYHRDFIDALLAAGDPAGARRALDRAGAWVPESRELHSAMEALSPPELRGRSSPMDRFRIDGREVIAAYERDRHQRGAYDSPAVIVLDRTVTRVFPKGARLTLTHNIMQVLSKDGIDKWGEVNLPEGADVLTLRAIKRDGTTREPEEIAEKESVSVPDLEVGDYVEVEYLDRSAAPAAFPGGFLAERFYFQSYDAPLDRTEYLLVTPPGMALAIDSRGAAPEVEQSLASGLEVRRWASRRRPQAFTEPSSAPFSEFLPSVRAASGISVAAWREYLRDQRFGTERSNAELRAIAKREIGGAPSDEEKLRRLDRWTRRHIKDGGLLDEPATSILAREEGSRVTLLAALLRAVGVPTEVWLARRNSAPRLDGALPDLEAYDHPLLFLPSLARMVSPRNRHAPAGFVGPELRGQPALRIAPGGAALAVVDARNPDDRRMDLHAKLAIDGSAEVRVRERLVGWPALQWRDALDKLAADRVWPEFEQRTLGFYFPGSTLQDLKWTGRDDDDAPFTVEYAFHVSQFARRVGGMLIVPAPYPATLGVRYAGVAVRKTPLYVDYAAPTHLEAHLAVPAGVVVDLPPAAAVENVSFGHFQQQVEREPEGLHLTARFEMAARRIGTELYPAFVEFVTRVDRAEARAAELRPRAPK